VVWCVLAQTILGSSVPLMRGVVHYPAMTGQAARYAAAAVLLTALARAGFGGPPPRHGWPVRRDLLMLVANAATGLVAFNLCMLTAVRHADPAVVGTIVGATPLVLAVLGPLLRGQRPTARLVAASVVIVVGTVLVHGFGHADALGTAAAVGTLICEAAFSVFAAAALPRLGALRVSAYSCALAVPMLVIGALMAREAPRLPTVTEAATLGYLAVMLTVVAFMAWFTGLHRLGIARAGLFVGVLPVATIVTTSIQDGRFPVPAQALGVLLVGAALTLGLRGRTTGSSSTVEDVAMARREAGPRTGSLAP
jgi:drug/metabolite transporter (DMT)-like permease